MSDEVSDFQERLGGLLALLSSNLQAAFCWPGADSLTTEDAVECYRQAVAAGRVPGLEDMLQAHPECAEHLRAFFRDLADGPGRTRYRMTEKNDTHK
jgi:hypothetical protein